MEGFVLKPFPYGDTEKTGFVHQLHAGAARLRPAVEDVPPWDAGTSRVIPESAHDACKSDDGINDPFFRQSLPPVFLSEAYPDRYGKIPG